MRIESFLTGSKAISSLLSVKQVWDNNPLWTSLTFLPQRISYLDCLNIKDDNWEIWITVHISLTFSYVKTSGDVFFSECLLLFIWLCDWIVFKVLLKYGYDLHNVFSFIVSFTRAWTYWRLKETYKSPYMSRQLNWVLSSIYMSRDGEN